MPPYECGKGVEEDMPILLSTHRFRVTEISDSVVMGDVNVND